MSPNDISTVYKVLYKQRSDLVFFPTTWAIFFI